GMVVAIAAPAAAPRPAGQAGAAPRAGTLRAARPVRAAENGLCHSARRLAARPAHRMVRRSALRARAGGERPVRRVADSPPRRGAPERTPQLAVCAVDHPDVPGLAPALGLSFRGEARIGSGSVLSHRTDSIAVRGDPWPNAACRIRR